MNASLADDKPLMQHSQIRWSTEQFGFSDPIDIGSESHVSTSETSRFNQVLHCDARSICCMKAADSQRVILIITPNEVIGLLPCPQT